MEYGVGNTSFNLVGETRVEKSVVVRCFVENVQFFVSTPKVPVPTPKYLGAYRGLSSLMRTTPQKAAQVIALVEIGLSQRAVGLQLDMTRAAVRRVYQRYEETGSFHRRPGIARKRSTTARDDRFIVSTTLRNRHLNAFQVQQQLREVRRVVISQWTVRRRLQESNLTPKTLAIGPKLTPAHRQARLRFARDHLNKTLEQWGSVLFSDEIRICLYGSDRRRKVYRRPRERFAECCIKERSAYGGGSFMIWGAISIGARTDPLSFHLVIFAFKNNVYNIYNYEQLIALT
ncbi:hypothetical protein NQ318_016188 [Aromia moschata]|uniref:Transposase Tc1-like domain-containing protein n=1 Tax=Aromia moschata TaxID=1265417 RepID=A0AAV8YF71_9CUCU|nr:hypothetical protein NQ318_016188 [Aromia moschata]